MPDNIVKLYTDLEDLLLEASKAAKENPDLRGFLMLEPPNGETLYLSYGLSEEEATYLFDRYKFLSHAAFLGLLETED